MNALRNQVTIVGNIGTDARITTFENGSMVARFSVAIERERTPNERYQLFAWGNLAHYIQRYCAKGNKIAVTGKLVNRTYVSPDGQPRRITEIEVRQLIKL